MYLYRFTIFMNYIDGDVALNKVCSRFAMSENTILTESIAMGRG